MKLVSPNPIYSARLCLRLLGDSDVVALLEVNGDEEVTRFLPYATWKSIADGQAWFEHRSGHQASGIALHFAIVAKDTGTAIGTCSLFQFDEDNLHAKIGYVLGRAFWGQGYAREAIAALIDFAFNEMSLRRLQAEAAPQNTASTRLLQRLGFKKEGVLRERWMTKDGTLDAEIYGLLRQEWLETSRPNEAPDQIQRSAPDDHR